VIEVDSFKKVNDPDATKRWVLNKYVHCRITDIDGSGEYSWQVWMDTEEGLMGDIDSGYEQSEKAAEKTAKKKAIEMYSESLASSERASKTSAKDTKAKRKNKLLRRGEGS
jgi:hypothetical protein